MKERMITVTEAARNFSDCVSRVHYQAMTFGLQKNGKLLARLVPASANYFRLELPQKNRSNHAGSRERDKSASGTRPELTTRGSIRSV